MRIFYLLYCTINVRSGKLTFNPEKLNFETIITSVFEVFHPISQEKNITVNYLIEKDLTVFADTNMGQTILCTLVSNGIKFTNNGEI